MYEDSFPLFQLLPFVVSTAEQPFTFFDSGTSFTPDDLLDTTHPIFQA